MSELWAALLLRAAAQVVLLLTGDGEGVNQLPDAAAHVAVQDEIGIVLNYRRTQTLVNRQVPVYT